MKKWIPVVVTALVSSSSIACSSTKPNVGQTAEALTATTCPADACDEITATAHEVDGAVVVTPDDTTTCTYYDGVNAPNGQWWSDHIELGWDMLVPGATPRDGTIIHRTCSISQLAGVGSMPSDHCAWKYQCVASNGG